MIAEFHTRDQRDRRTRAWSRPSADRRPRRQDRQDGGGGLPGLRRPRTPCWPTRDSTSSASARRAEPTSSRPCRPPGRASTSSSRSRWRSRCRGATPSSTPAQKAGVRLCTIFPSRFTPANIALKMAIDEGRFGRLTLGDTYVKWWRTQEYYDSGGWRGTWELDGGGALMNQAIHNVDLLHWLMGDVAAVRPLTAHSGPRADRGRGHGRRGPALQERRARGHRGGDERLSRACSSEPRSTATAARPGSSRTTSRSGSFQLKISARRARSTRRWRPPPATRPAPATPAASPTSATATSSPTSFRRSTKGGKPFGRRPRRSQVGRDHSRDLSLGHGPVQPSRYPSTRTEVLDGLGLQMATGSASSRCLPPF